MKSRLLQLYLAYLLFVAVDIVRVLWPPPQQSADEVEWSWFYRPAQLIGLAHAENTRGYEIATYRTFRGFKIGEPELVAPFALVPLNVPERSGGRLVMVEFSAAEDAPRPDIEGVVFMGLLGPIPDDLIGLLEKKVDARVPPPMRLQPAEMPSIRISLVVLSFVLFVGRYVLQDAQAGWHSTPLSSLGVLVAQVPMFVMIAMRLRFDPTANRLTEWFIALFSSGLMLALALSTKRARKVEQSDAEFEAANAIHDRLR